MLRLILFRHAKAIPHDAAPDFERSLDARGEAEALDVGRYLQDEQLWPDRAFVSPSRRTQQTWALACQALGDVPTLFDDTLYDADADGLRLFIRNHGATTRSLLICAHNPGLEDLATASVGFGDRYAYARMKGHFAPASLAVLDFDLDDWRDMQPNMARLDRFRLPLSGA